MGIPRNTASSEQSQQIAAEFGEQGYSIADLAARHLLPTDQIEEELRDAVRSWLSSVSNDAARVEELEAKVEELEAQAEDDTDEIEKLKDENEAMKRDLSATRDAFSTFKAALKQALAHAPEAPEKKEGETET